MRGKIKAICISEKRGTAKHKVKEAELIENHGIKGDAHAGNWHRQVSLLSYEKVEDFRKRGADVADGAFGENLLIDGMDCGKLPVGALLKSGEILLEVTQIGKECHSGCEIFHQVGDCIMPREGIFAKVLHGGKLVPGDRIEVFFSSEEPGSRLTGQEHTEHVAEHIAEKHALQHAEKERSGEGKVSYRAAVLTLSDKGSRGEREDTSGKWLCGCLKAHGYQLVHYRILPDEQEQISDELKRLSDDGGCDLILTTGGTGFSKRDCAPEAAKSVIEREVPGIAEAIRSDSMRITRRAMLSRAVSGIRKDTLIINLPGSRKAVEESMECILDTIEHGLAILTGQDGECGRC